MKFYVDILSKVLFLISPLFSLSVEANESMGKVYVSDVNYKLEVEQFEQAELWGSTIEFYNKNLRPNTYKAALSILQKFQKGDAFQACMIAHYYSEKPSSSYVFKNIDKAISWAELAYKNKEVCGAVFLRKLYADGYYKLGDVTGREDSKKEIQWLQKIIELKPGHDKGLYEYRLAIKYFMSEGVNQDIEKYKYYLSKSCNYGYTTACKSLENYMRN